MLNSNTTDTIKTAGDTSVTESLTQKTNAIRDIPDEIDASFGLVFKKLDDWLDGLISLIPNIIVSLILLVALYFIGKLAKRFVLKQFSRTGRTNLGEVLSSSIRWIIYFIGGLLIATILIPNLKLADLVAGMGISSIAIGFAFKDILQNWLSGILLLIRQPFQIGDLIVVNSHEGFVEHIETRSTILRTFDGLKVVIPNSEIYTSAILVKTSNNMRRGEYDIGIGYADDINQAIQVISDCIAQVSAIADKPEPQVFVWDLAPSWVTIRARWWFDVNETGIVTTRSEIIHKVKYALDKTGIDMPFDTVVNLVEKTPSEHT